MKKNNQCENCVWKCRAACKFTPVIQSIYHWWCKLVLLVQECSSDAIRETGTTSSVQSNPQSLVIKEGAILEMQ